MLLLITLLQQTNIDEKIKNAPDNGYMIGVWIGYILPFVVFAGLAWLLYRKAKKRQDEL
ncbi:hypothetical protein [Flavobacterium cheonhonense]|jgi:ATP-dependent Zn protease|uniref:hypothetical protein n=1 Tax=Flavobacterium cheonhonense TaxID=706185 RepID=UPI0026BE762C|nr:hypothetical protein [Flavobacterium cheonhonense]